MHHKGINTLGHGICSWVSPLAIFNMADENRSAKGKATAAVVVDNEIGSTSGHKEGSHGGGDLSSHAGSRAAVDNRRDGGYRADDLTTNMDPNGSSISASLSPLSGRLTTHMDSCPSTAFPRCSGEESHEPERVARQQEHEHPNGGSFSRCSGPDSGLYSRAPSCHYYGQYVDPGYSYWPTGGHGGGITAEASFALPFSAGAGGIPAAGPQHVRTGNQLSTGISTQHDELYHSANANANRGGGATFPSPHPWSIEQIDSFIGDSLRSLSIRDRGNSLLARDRGGRHQLSSEFVNSLQVPPPPQDLVGSTGGQNNNPAAASLGRGRLLSNAADHQYVGRRLKDVRGSISSIARTTTGCRFLVRTVAEGGAATAQQVLDEVAGDVVRLMVHADGHALVEALVLYLADESMARVLEVLDAASPAQIVAVCRSHHGSNILRTLIGRIAGNPDHAEFFTRTLAHVGEKAILSLMEDMDGSRLIMRCLDTFSAAHNQFITVAMAMSLHRVCRDRHGCHVVNRCIDMAGGVDGQMWSSLVRGVCWDGFALAEHGYGNYVVQHVLRCVPQARAALHAAFRGRYVSLSTQMAGSHVVQRCLELLSPEQADEIVGELIGCHHWGGCTFQQLISDRFANFVLQTAMERTEIQMHNRLLEAVVVHSDELRENMFARNIYRKLCNLRRIYRPFRAT